MRPVKLKMTAFGPYKGEQVIEFEKLKDKSIFLITGPTGSGKTTIFDGICYALYGKASGDGRDGESMRSHFADEDILTQIELTFDIKGKRYYIKRIPAQLKKKARGEGYTEQKADAEFKNLSDDSKVTAGIKNVDEKVIETIGLTYEQFKQIIMIPQGEFRELLTAKSDDRSLILQKIFGTRIYKEIQDLLEEKRKEIEDKIKTLKYAEDENIIKIQSNDDCILDDHKKSRNTVSVIERTEFLIKKDRDLSENIKNKGLELNKLIESKLRDITRGEMNNKKFKEKEDAEESLKELQKNEDLFKEKKIRIQLGRRALNIKGSEENLILMGEALKNKEKEYDIAVKNEEKLKTAFEKWKKDLEGEGERENKRQRCIKEKDRLQFFIEKIKEAEDKKSNLKKVEELILKLNNSKKDLEDKLKINEKLKGDTLILKEKAIAAKEEFLKLSVEYERVLNILNKLNDLRIDVTNLIKLRNEYKEKNRKCIESKKNIDNLKDEYEKLQDEFIKGQAAILAAELKDGEKCPVCGSIHHPNPAKGSGGSIGEDILRSKKKNLDELSKKLEELTIENNSIKEDGIKLSGRVESIKESLKGDLVDIEDYKDEDLTTYIQNNIKVYEKNKEEKKEELIKSKREKDREKEYTTNLKKIEDEIIRLKEEVEKIQETLVNERIKYSSERGSIESLLKDIPEDYRELNKLNLEFKRLEIEAENIRKRNEEIRKEYEDSRVEHEKALSILESSDKGKKEAAYYFDEAKVRFNEEIKKYGFLNEEEYKLYSLKEEVIAKFEKEVGEFEANLKSAQDRVNKAVDEIKGIELLDINKLNNELNDLKNDKLKLDDEFQIIYIRIDNNSKIIDKLKELKRQIEKKEEEYQEVGYLASISRGKNEKRITFERYVLGVYLDDIIRAANIRFAPMTQKRYYMSRMVERQKGGSQSGLEIEVYDNYTGRSRHVKTLSGGESFKASLSLALGLADVVQSKVGGINLETMFVDEGFGSLDPESLDNAINCLLDLKSSGRLVGIISHVPELKERIDSRLEIETGTEGSFAKFFI